MNRIESARQHTWILVVRCAVGHGGPFKTSALRKLFIGYARTTKVGTTKVGSAQASITQYGILQVDQAQVLICEDGTTKVGSSKVGTRNSHCYFWLFCSGGYPREIYSSEMGMLQVYMAQVGTT